MQINSDGFEIKRQFVSNRVIEAIKNDIKKTLKVMQATVLERPMKNSKQ